MRLIALLMGVLPASVMILFYAIGGLTKEMAVMGAITVIGLVIIEDEQFWYKTDKKKVK